jgi:hypothetical protein
MKIQRPAVGEAFVLGKCRDVKEPRSLRQGGDFPEKCISFLENTTRFLTLLQAMTAW